MNTDDAERDSRQKQEQIWYVYQGNGIKLPAQVITIIFEIIIKIISRIQTHDIFSHKQTNSVTFRLQAKYTDRSATAYWRS